MHYKYVAEKLNEAEQEAASPAAEWLDYKNVFRSMREKYCAYEVTGKDLCFDVATAEEALPTANLSALSPATP
jgi:hypothetical protein